MISFGSAPCDEGVIRAAVETPGCAERARPWVLAATILGSSMAFIDGSVVTVALPAIQADLATSVAGAQWVANAYTLMLGALILVGGSAGDRFGRRRVFALGVATFTAASGANVMTLLLYFALGGVLFLLPFNLIRIQGYSATFAGAAFLPFTLIMGGLSRWSGGLIHRYGARKPLTIGPVIVAAGSALFALPGIGGSYWTTFFPAMAVHGLGMAISVAPLTTTVMGAAGSQHAGTASGINNAISRIAGMLAISLLGTLVVGVFGATLDTRLAELQVPPEIRHALNVEVPKFAEAKVPPQIEGEQRRILEKVLEESFVRSFRVAMLVAAGLALTSALCAGLMICPLRRNPPVA